MTGLDVTMTASLFSKVRTLRPLVHHITNEVTVNDCANVTLAIGASPVMATSIEEVADMVALADALVLNLGTIQTTTFESMRKAGKEANVKGIPVVLDPVGVGATEFRKRKAKELLQEVNVSIIRGNRSEVHALIADDVTTKGVDVGESEDANTNIESIAMTVANAYKTVVVMSGKTDIVCDGESIVKIHNGDAWLPSITGTGCMSTSMIASMASVTDNMFHAAIAGMSAMGLSGERAKQQLGKVDGIGMFRTRLMDQIFHMTSEIWTQEIQLEVQS